MTSRDNPNPPRRRVSRPTRPRRSGGPAPLAATTGPDPAAPVSAVRLEVGRLGAPHGLRGHLRLNLTTDDPEHLRTVKRVYVGEESTPRRVTDVRWHGNTLLIQLAGITTPEAARQLTGQAVRIAGSDARPLAPGEYFLYQLIGLRVESETGEPLGTVTDLLETGANDVLVVTPAAGGAPLLVPNVPEFVLAINPAEGRLIAKQPEYFGE